MRQLPAILVAALIVFVFRLWLVSAVPLQILLAGHDDGLFMRLAANVLSGQWLGPYNQLTLAKGPVYPTFLAGVSLSGLSVSTAHALLQAGAITASGWAAYRLSGEKWVGLLCFTLLSLHPIGFSPEVQRVIRDQVFWPLVLLSLASSSIGLLSSQTSLWPRIGWGGIAGLSFGFAWYTREESAWLLAMPVAFAIATLLVHMRRRRESGPVAVSLTVAVGCFLLVSLGVQGLNAAYYGRFVGVEMRDPNFVAALDALQSVDPQPYVPVPRSVFDEISAVSITFAKVAPFVDWNWGAYACQYYPSACGEVGGGWFMWAFRDAVAAAGGYTSSERASEIYKGIADEVNGACAAGRLSCSRSLIPYMPPLSEDQWRSLPMVLAKVSSKVVFYGILNRTGFAGGLVA